MDFFYVKDSELILCDDCMEYNFEQAVKLSDADGPHECDWCGNKSEDDEEDDYDPEDEISTEIHHTPHENGRHPEHAHLVYFEVEQEHGMYLLTTPAKPGYSALISWEDWLHAVGIKRQAELEFAYLPDDYLDVLSLDLED